MVIIQVVTLSAHEFSSLGIRIFPSDRFVVAEHELNFSSEFLIGRNLIGMRHKGGQFFICRKGETGYKFIDSVPDYEQMLG